jgi:hypothetical protein
VLHADALDVGVEQRWRSRHRLRILAMSGSLLFYAGLASSLGCDATHFTGCAGPANDGPDSFLAFAVPAPEIGHGLPVALAGGGLLLGFKLWKRSQKHRSLGTTIPHAAA